MVLLGADGRSGLGAQRDELLRADLGVVEPQARPADAVIDHRVELEVASIPDPQAGLDQHDHEIAGRRVGQPRERGVGLELVHDEFGE